METKVAIWTVVLCIVVSYWFYLNSELEIEYDRHIQLSDQDTGIKHSPSEFLDLDKIIHPKPEYINSTDAIQRLYDLVYLSTFENPLAIDQSYSKEEEMLVSGWPVANQTRCTNQLDWIHDRLTQHARGNYSSLRGQLGFDLTKFMDSFGRPESGLFSGSIHWLGSYKNCLAASLDEGQIKTRYCLLKMRFKSWPRKENIHPATRIRVGVCLPETCDTSSYESLKRQIDQLATFDLPERLKNDLEADSLFCLPDERSPLRQIPPAGRIYLVIMVAWLAIVLAATVVYESIIRPRQAARRKKLESFAGLRDFNDLLRCKKDLSTPVKAQTNSPTDDDDKDPKPETTALEQIISAVSIRTCIKAFKMDAFRVKYNQGENVRLNLSCLDSFKVVLMLMVVLTHAAFLSSTYMRSLGNRIEFGAAELASVGVTVTRTVDMFFLLFGVLTSYNLVKKSNEEQISNPLMWLAINVLIFIRIAPLFMVVYWYSKLISPYTGSGPWWDYGVDKATVRTSCLSDPWWKAIPYFGCAGIQAAGVTRGPYCNMPSWFIVSYSQLSLIMPLITYLMCKLPPGRLARGSLVGFLLLASAGMLALRLYLQTSVREEGPTLYGAFLFESLEKFESTSHVITLSRLGAVAVGCLVGYLLRRYEEMQIAKWPKWITSKLVNVGCVLVVLAMIIVPVARHRIYLNTGWSITWTEFIGFNVLLVFLQPLTVSVLILSWTTQYNHLVWIRFFSHSFWHVFNRLGLCIFLIHWEVLLMVTTGYEQAPTYGFGFDIMKTWAFGVVFSILIALIIHVLIEAPVSNLLVMFYRYIARNYLELPLPAKTGQQLKAPQRFAIVAS